MFILYLYILQSDSQVMDSLILKKRKKDQSKFHQSRKSGKKRAKYTKPVEENENSDSEANINTEMYERLHQSSTYSEEDISDSNDNFSRHHDDTKMQKRTKVQSASESDDSDHSEGDSVPATKKHRKKSEARQKHGKRSFDMDKKGYKHADREEKAEDSEEEEEDSEPEEDDEYVNKHFLIFVKVVHLVATIFQNRLVRNMFEHACKC